MMQAGELIEEIGRELRPVQERILRHPYLDALEAARVPRYRLRLLVGEQHSIIASDLRSVAHLACRFGASESRDFFLNVLQGERAAWGLLQDFARALGMGPEDLEAYEPLPGANAYTCYMAWLALYGSAAEVAAAYLVNFAAWGRNCARVSKSLKERYGLDQAARAFFDFFASTPPGFEEAARAVVAGGLAEGVDPRLVRRAARLLQGFELLYWDTLHEASAGTV